MKRNIPLLILYFFFYAQSFAQSNLPAVYEIKSDTAKEQRLDSSYWQKLEDKDGKWGISDISKSTLSEKFHTAGSKADGIDTNNIHTYWHRYRLKNAMGQDAKISLTYPVEYFDVYIIRNDSLPVSYHSGFLQQWNKKDGLKHARYYGAIPLKIKPNEEILIYDRRHMGAVTNFETSVYFYSTEKLIQDEYVDYVDGRTFYFAKIHLQEAFLLGLLLLTVFLNLLFYRIVNEKVYLYFALFALFLGFNRLTNIASVYSIWEHPSLREYVPLLSFAWGFIPVFLIQFFRHFLKTKIVFPRWDKILFSLGILNLLIVVVAFFARLFFKNAASSFYKISSFLPFLVIPICIVITLLLFTRKKDKPIRYLIIGSFPLLLLYLIASPAEVLGIKINFLDVVFMNNFRLIEVLCITWLVISFSLILLLRFDHLRKENTQLIEKQKAELEIQVAQRTADLQRSVENLRSTQAQLIQSEKMASLGELTAGIAHEIQNPLNFVNNFSEVSNELVDEMNNELNKGDIEEAKAIAGDIKQNLEKINHHGKRADAIVKGMLQHSRSSTGQKEPTNINALADEYLRLAYHGLRGKDNSFNVTMNTDFDEAIGKINIIPQDIGRVLLNLYNNAFYAITPPLPKEGVLIKNEVSDPTVWVSTKGEGNKLMITVRDNGKGIPANIVDKIFQPFFTTKPTGQGTGLGLSLSYDIVKAHGGDIKVTTKESEGSTFVITLPCNT